MLATNTKTITQWPWIMLLSRIILFAAFQALFVILFLSLGASEHWMESAKWWPIVIVLTDLVGLALLIRLYRQEGHRFRESFRIQRQFIKKDLLFMLGFLVIAGPIGYLPSAMSARWLFGDPQAAMDMLVRPLPAWAAIFSFLAFPLLQGLVEIPTYMLYSLPRLEAQGVRPWLAVSLASIFLSAQHMFAPFILDLRFITYRLVMFLPFAVLVAVIMRARPRLMPFMAVIHALMDMSIAVAFLMVMK